MIYRRIRLTVLASTACLALLGAAPTQATLRIFVVNATDNTVSVIDGDLDREIKTVPVEMFPQGLAIRSADPLLAVANSRAHSVTLIDPVTLEQVGDPVRVGLFPLDMKFSPDGKTLWVTCYDDQNVVAVDVATRQLVGDPIPLGAPPRRVKISADGRFVYAIKYDKAGGIVVANAQTHKVVKIIPVNPFPTDMVITPDGKRMFAASFNLDTVSVIDLDLLEIIDTFKMSVGNGLLIHPTKPLLYSMVTFDDEVVVFDYAAKKEVKNIPVGQYPIYSAMSPDGRFVYAVNSTDSNVMKIDTETNEVLLKIAVGLEPTDAVVFEMPSERPLGLVLAAAGVLGLALAAIAVRALARTRRRATPAA